MYYPDLSKERPKLVLGILIFLSVTFTLISVPNMLNLVLASYNSLEVDGFVNEIESSSRGKLNVHYTYTVNGKDYSNDVGQFNYAFAHFRKDEKIIVKYNKNHPKISIIKGTGYDLCILNSAFMIMAVVFLLGVADYTKNYSKKVEIYKASKGLKEKQ